MKSMEHVDDSWGGGIHKIWNINLYIAIYNLLSKHVISQLSRILGARGFS